MLSDDFKSKLQKKQQGQYDLVNTVLPEVKQYLAYLFDQINDAFTQTGEIVPWRVVQVDHSPGRTYTYGPKNQQTTIGHADGHITDMQVLSLNVPQVAFVAILIPEKIVTPPKPGPGQSTYPKIDIIANMRDPHVLIYVFASIENAASPWSLELALPCGADCPYYKYLPDRGVKEPAFKSGEVRTVSLAGISEMSSVVDAVRKTVEERLLVMYERSRYQSK